MQKINYTIGILALLLFVATIAVAHTPLCSCYDNGDGTITCEGSFSDGSSASGVEIRAIDKNKNVLIKGTMDEDSEFSCKKPAGPYKVILDAGPGHTVEIDGDEIVD